MKPFVDASQPRSVDVSRTRRRRRVRFTLPNGNIVCPRRVELALREPQLRLCGAPVEEKHRAEEGDNALLEPKELQKVVIRGGITLRRFKRFHYIDVPSVLPDSSSHTASVSGDCSSGADLRSPSGHDAPCTESGAEPCPDGFMDELLNAMEGEF